MQKLWLVFAQSATVCVAVLFVVSTLRPDLLAWNSRDSIVTLKEPSAEAPPVRIASFSDAAQKAMPAVVNISTTKEVKLSRHPLMEDPVFRYFFGDQVGGQTQKSTNLGSGVIVSEKGYILTNSHVVEAADEIEVALADSRRARARVVGSDPETDIAVLKVDLAGLPSITFGRPEQARVGDVVLAIGNPYGFGSTVTLGIVSALGRSNLPINIPFQNYIQTDAAVNPGNSGGALVDISGDLIGINSSIYSSTGSSVGIGFAIPASVAKGVLEQIVQNGGVTRGWIGVAALDITVEIAKSFKLADPSGALISEVMSGGPADKAGVKAGDVLVAVNGNPVPRSSVMLELIAGLKPGQDARLTVIREQRKTELVVTVGRRPRPQR
ncbi:MAG: trypsin-like peptidase domain-containing protein [Betaproteobacteria bacterium]